MSGPDDTDMAETAGAERVGSSSGREEETARRILHVDASTGRHLLGPFLYTISTMHCMTVSLAQDGDGLGTCWGRELALKMLEEAGFHDVDVQQLPHDIMNDYYLAR